MSANLCKGVNSSHTPGPWIVSHDPDAYSDDDYRVFDQRDGDFYTFKCPVCGHAVTKAVAK